MELKTLIFSNQLKHRMLRHTFFWSALFCVPLVAGHGFINIQGFKKIMQWDILYAMSDNFTANTILLLRSLFFNTIFFSS